MTTLLGFRRLQLLWISVGGPRGWSALMAAIALAESGGQVTVVQRTQPPATTGWGLWQITPGTEAMLTARRNAQLALGKFASAATPLDPWWGDRTWKAWVADGRPVAPSVEKVKGYLASWGWTTTTPGLREAEMISTAAWTDGATSHVVITTTTPTGKAVLTREHYYQATLGTTRAWHLDPGFPPAAS